MIELLLPRTDAGAAVQLVAVVAFGVPALLFAVRRRAPNAAWLIAGVVVETTAFFALRTVH